MKKRLNICVMVLSLTTALGFAAGGSKMTSPCQSGETWEKSDSLAPETVKQLEDLLARAVQTKQPLEEMLKVLDSAAALVSGRESDEVKVWANYAVARSYFALGYPHLADSLFASTIIRYSKRLATNSAQPQVGGLLAGIACLNVISEIIPASARNLELVAAIERVGNAAGPESLALLQEAEFHLLQQELRSGKGVLGNSYQLLSRGGPFGFLGQALLSQSAGNRKAAMGFLAKFLSQPRAAAQKYTELATLLLARHYLASDQGAKGIGLLKQIPPTSNYFPEVLSDRGDRYVRKLQYRESTDELMNLQFGPMLKTFQPAAHAALIRSLAELCQYPAAYRMLQAYQAKYRPMQAFLKKSVDQLATVSLYSQLPDALNSDPAKRSGVRVVALDWVRSADFLANQKEINVLLEEKNLLLGHLNEIKVRGGEKMLGVGGRTFQLLLKEIGKQIPLRERKLVAVLEGRLQRSARKMLAQVDEATARTAILEADILRLAGSGMVRQAASQYVSPKPQVASVEGAQLDWGAVRANELEKIEIWSDELGSLRSLFENRCGG